MNAHLFTHDTGSKICNVDGCGKTRGAKIHKDAKAALSAQVEADVAMEAAMDEECPQDDAVAEARQDMLPDVSDATDDGEIADELARLEAQEAAKVEAAKPAKKAPAKKAAKKADKGAPTATIWVGWRITNAAVLQDTKVAAKLKAAKPTADLDRTVKLTAEELGELDTVAASFMTEGHTGPEIYSGRALRGRIAAALAKIEEASK